jgi:hypothetical protein
MQILIMPNGMARCIYDEAVDLAGLGRPTIQRGSHVEPDEKGNWIADLSPVGGPVLRPFARRSDALRAEAAWLEAHWILPSAYVPGATPTRNVSL